MKGVAVEAIGASGGLISMWNEEFFKAEACISNQRCIILSASVETEQRDLWGFVVNAQQSCSDPWVVAGDFNTVLDMSERVGEWYNMGSIRSFNRFLLRSNTIDIPMHGSKFTCSNNRDHEAWARLDRFLLSPIILSWLPNII
ncbi:hypothetical protein Dsin_023660 [Dipteronia sinensis]|uniref:Endonuclease/exonuclease/phosphatase domain-containing protein n=1 Tax=Dipteronia sinensis TaxID=43782 RepID=A0AAE0E0W0_9ROSI|nr:hypothetical protein Dsin_023660 [Dipteronia sinensis]